MAKLRITALDGEHQGEVLEAQGNPKERMSTFEGVIEAVSVRYLKFAGNGVPLRVTATVKLEEFVLLSRLLEEERGS